MGRVCSGERVNEGGAVGDCGGVVIAREMSLSQVMCTEIIAVSAAFTNDTSQVRMQLIFNTSGLH